MSEVTYKIVRHFAGDYPNVTMLTGLTLKEAKSWCNDPETSSTTCKHPNSLEITERFGPWFDGFDEE